MKAVLVPAALTLFAAAVVFGAFLPDERSRHAVALADIDLQPAPDADAEEILADALLANSSTAFEGKLTVVGLDGPSVFQMSVQAGMDGERTVTSGSWLFGRDDATAWASSDDGHWLERGAAAATGIEVDALLVKYDVEIAGLRELPTGTAWQLVVTEQTTDIQREWLCVDVTTGLLVRRETFNDSGTAVRLVAFETLRTAGRLTPLMKSPQPLPEGAAATMAAPESWNGIDIAELPGNYHLMGVSQPGDEMPTAALLFSDGLYHLSVYPIPGELNGGHLAGAVLEKWEGRDLYRWPGAEPQRLVWSGDGHTFTAITDAPLDAVFPAISQFPADASAGVLTRMRRGVERVADALWPFN